LGRSRPEYKAICQEILNENYSTLATGSENFKSKGKNLYEEALFKVEDDMYKVDFDLNNVHSTMNLLKEEKDKIEKLTPEEKQEYKLDRKRFNYLRLKQIERVYGEHG
jgi:histone deacetylase complex regulatory component SIN3